MNVHEWADFGVFHTLIAGLIHCVLLGYFLWKKDKIGYYIVMAYQIVNGLILSFATGEFIINLLLLLRKNGKSGFKTIFERN